MKKALLASVVTVIILTVTNFTISAQQAAVKSQHEFSKPSFSKDVAHSKVKEVSKVPYEGYAGNKDLAAAKKAWIKDHKEEYKKQANYTPKHAPVAKPAIDLDPNKNRRLPKNYDDSKTNNSSKN